MLENVFPEEITLIECLEHGIDITGIAEIDDAHASSTARFILWDDGVEPGVDVLMVGKNVQIRMGETLENLFQGRVLREIEVTMNAHRHVTQFDQFRLQLFILLGLQAVEELGETIDKEKERLRPSIVTNEPEENQQSILGEEMVDEKRTGLVDHSTETLVLIEGDQRSAETGDPRFKLHRLHQLCRSIEQFDQAFDENRQIVTRQSTVGGHRFHGHLCRFQLNSSEKRKNSRTEGQLMMRHGSEEILDRSELNRCDSSWTGKTKIQSQRQFKSNGFTSSTAHRLTKDSVPKPRRAL